MEDKLLEELYASYKGDTYAAQLRNAVEKYGDLKTAEMIIDQFGYSQSNSDTSGAIGFRVSYWNRLKTEFDKLVCGHSQYAKESKDFYVFGKFFSLATASSMATTLAPMLSIPVYILTPTIALMLHSMMKIGINAYCNTVNI